MADRKISDLTALTAPAAGDYLPIVDISEASAANKNKRITIEELLRGAPDGTAAAPGIGFESDPNTGIYRPGSDQVAISTGGTARLFVDSSGRVGVGTSSPSYKLDVRDASVSQITSSVSGAQIAVLGSDTSTGAYIGTLDNYDFKFLRNSALIGAWTATGLGVGTTSPGVKIDVVSDNNTSLASVLRVNSNNVAVNTALAYDGLICNSQLTIGNTTTNPIIFNTNSTERARIDSSGRLLVGTSSARTNLFNTTYTALFQVESQTTSAAQAVFTSSTAGVNGANLLLCHQRSGSIGGNTVVQADDQLGIVSFQGADGSEMVPAAGIECYIDGTPGANDMPGRLVFSTTADGASSPTERMRISSDGKSGVYSANPDTFIASSSSAAGNTNYLFRGAYSASAPLTGTVSFQVTTNGDVTNTNGSYTSISDEKLKENIVDAGSQWNDLKAIQIRNWNFKEETGHQTHRQIGPIAQELEQVCPNLVFEILDRDENGNETGEVTKGVNQSVLYMKAVKALQEAMERIETLEAKVAALEGA